MNDLLWEQRFPMEETARTDGKDAVWTDGPWHLVAMRPTAAAMVTLPPGSVGRRVRLEVPVAIRPPDPAYMDACWVARALKKVKYTDRSGVLHDLSGPVTGGLWFANAAGQLADATGTYLPPRTCASVGSSWLTPPVAVGVRPVMSVAEDYAVASVTMEAVVSTSRTLSAIRSI